MANEQINVPSLLFILVVSGLAVRWLFFSPSPPARPRDPASVQRSREAAVERIQQMFPQVERRTILWDLQRNGGNIAATTERILSGRMETPPVTFQPPPPPASARSAQTQSQAAPPVDKPAQPDLITRYNLQNKVAAAGEAETEEAPSNGRKGWSSNKEERQSLLQKRRDEMILAARRKMEAKMAAEKATGAAI